MYQFSSWCFLCASEKQVDVDIQSLDEPLRQGIGQFSIINYTLLGVPSKICHKCHIFLKDYESRKERYASVEQMFMELIKAKNKTVDFTVVREKYNLFEDEADNVLENINYEDSPHFFEIIEEYYEPEQSDTKTSIDLRPFNKIPDVSSPSKQSPRKSERTKPSPVVTKILNPTIHPKIINVNRSERFSCDHCQHTTSTKTSIERHMKQIHLKPSSSLFTCATCTKTFAKKNILQAHEKIHLLQRPTFECSHCNKVLSSKTAVANHIKWFHKENRDFECQKCQKLFATKGSLKEHEKIHSDFKGHICPICKKSYKTASTLTQHLDTHGETEYHCSICQLRLNSKRTLRQHMLKHSDVVKFTCKICNAQFKRTKAYKEHLISQHTAIKAYKCDWCARTFSNGANCRKHKKETHPEELAEADKYQKKKVVKLPKIEELLSMSFMK